MSGAARLTVIAAVLALLAAVLPSPAAASDGASLTGLRVVGGDVWHADNVFRVEWDPNPPTPFQSVVRYAVRGPQREALPGYETHTVENPWNLVTVKVPPAPGVYWFEAWNHVTMDVGSADGPRVAVPLYFDDAQPPAVSVSAPAWVAAGTRVPIRVAPPTPPLPLSRIQGYAVSVDAAAGASPCALADRCAPAEIDLPVGGAPGAVSLPTPPEGVSYVHAVAVSGSGKRSARATTLAIGVDGTPPQVQLDGSPGGWAAGPVTVTAIASDPLSGMASTGPGGPETAIEVDGGPPLLAPGATVSATVAGEGNHRVAYWGRDAVGNAGDGSLPFARPAATTVRIDETEPTVRFAAGDPGDPERIEATVSDRLSGPAADRGRIELRPVGSTGRFQALPTEVGHGRLVARWSSDDYPRGAYELRAVGYDAAGNPAASTRGADGAPLVLHNPVKGVARLAFGFGADKLVFQRCTRADGARRCHRAVIRSFAKRPTSRALPCCHGALVGGRLLTGDGEPLPGQSVGVVETFARGARTGTRTTTVTTDARGAFRAWLAPGPSRRVSAQFDGTHRLTRASGLRLRLRVRAGVHLRVSTTRVKVGGAPVVFHGLVVHPEARIPPTGLPVHLEFRLPGTAWAEFRTLQTDSAGRFAYPYTFSDDDSNGVRFLFRAFVPATGNWAYAPAASRPQAVTG
ncbi:MAG: hypothetical protein JST08_17610 [Actinobacteria bacterium]|nr:hypothetical protein [Actinomycetota bacterium]